jgi:hypothetical protein
VKRDLASRGEAFDVLDAMQQVSIVAANAKAHGGFLSIVFTPDMLGEFSSYGLVPISVPNFG